MQGRSIEAFSRPGQRGARTALILGGFHGDEPKSVFVCRQLIELLGREPQTATDVAWVIVPEVNPDGLAIRTRRNANRVDLNRNFPTSNWTVGSRRSRMFGGTVPASEPETRAAIRLIERVRPDWIITIHSIGAGRFCNNYDGPALRLSRAMHRLNRYPVRRSIGYPTPGSFGSWAGIERRIPTLTLELPSLHSRKRCWEDNRLALLSARP